jgi:hypothetical protein
LCAAVRDPAENKIEDGGDGARAELCATIGIGIESNGVNGADSSLRLLN